MTAPSTIFGFAFLGSPRRQNCPFLMAHEISPYRCVGHDRKSLSRQFTAR